MRQTRIPYELTDERAPLKGPGGKRLIVHIVVNARTSETFSRDMSPS